MYNGVVISTSSINTDPLPIEIEGAIITESEHQIK
jgi:hypothetical protein